MARGRSTYIYKLINWFDEVFEEFEAKDATHFRDIVRGRGGSYIVEIWEKYSRAKLPSTKAEPVKRFIWIDSPEYIRHEGTSKAHKVEIQNEEEALDYFPVEYKSKYSKKDLTKLMNEGLNENDARYVLRCNIKKHREDGKPCYWVGDRDNPELQRKMNTL